LEAPDLEDPERTIVIGLSGKDRVLFVVIVVLDSDDAIRILSARKASPTRRRKHEEAP